jgi:8-oxo-dGTP pyrophosphatase MutT (NUDIX family)
VTPRPASTVILVRDAIQGQPETFMVRRDPRSRFAADAFVFPGGAVQDDDYVPGGIPPFTGLSSEEAHRRLIARGSDAPASPAQSLALHVAAVRELFEEAGILLARHAYDETGAGLLAETCDTLAGLRPGMQRGEVSLTSVASDLGLELMPEDLVYFSHWITPPRSPRRFDTRFFVVEDRPGQTASHCGVETVDGVWITPGEAIRRFEDGEITLVSVTADHLRVLDQFQTTAELMAFARSKPIRTVKEGGRDFRETAGWASIEGGIPW